MFDVSLKAALAEFSFNVSINLAHIDCALAMAEADREGRPFSHLPIKA